MNINPSGKDKLDLSVIIVNYNVYGDLKVCINSINEFTEGISYEIIVVDNCSPDREIDSITTDFPEVKYIPNHSNMGFGAANNIGLKSSKGRIIALINPDIIFKDNSLKKLIDLLRSSDELGIVGPVMISPSGEFERYNPYFPTIFSRFIQEFGINKLIFLMRFIFYKHWNKNLSGSKPFSVDWVVGGCLIFKREVYDRIYGFNEAFFLYDEEMEFQYRANKKGWKVNVDPSAIVVHNHHSSTSKIGSNFIFYHVYRSRIIFTNLHNKFFSRLVRKTLLFIAFLFKLLFTFIGYIFTFRKNYWKRIIIILSLMKLLFRKPKDMIADRYDFGKNASKF